MVTQDDYVESDMFDQDKAMAAAVNRRKFTLKNIFQNNNRKNYGHEIQV